MSVGDEVRRWRPDTYAVRGGLTRSEFDETSEAVFLTSGFVYDSAQQAEAAFKDVIDKFGAQGAEPFATDPAQFATLLHADIKKWGEVVKASGAKLD